ncbi:DUF642 domain-containing protein [Sorangium sp. So ce1182]|uniref:DUF642 domain-containing protein n=1 Tax=Sorangium sp. So ce1182 TaxID=3133334 RepID=UPI003F63E5D1
MIRKFFSLIRVSLLPLVTLSAIVMGMSADAQAQAELIVNGDFEEPQLAHRTWQTFVSITGWRLSRGSSIEIQNRVAGSPASGNQLVELDGWDSSAIYQDVSTVPGNTYRLTMAFSPRPGRPASDNVLEVYWNNQILDWQSRPGDGLQDTSWIWLSYRVTATSSLTRLELRDAGVSNSYGTYVDSVSLRPE